MKIGRCGRCQHGISAMDGEKPFTICALMPPTTVVIGAKADWIRPPMANAGWCGQFRLGWLRLLGYGARA